MAGSFESGSQKSQSFPNEVRSMHFHSYGFQRSYQPHGHGYLTPDNVDDLIVSGEAQAVQAFIQEIQKTFSLKHVDYLTPDNPVEFLGRIIKIKKSGQITMEFPQKLIDNLLGLFGVKGKSTTNGVKDQEDQRAVRSLRCSQSICLQQAVHKPQFHIQVPKSRCMLWLKQQLIHWRSSTSSRNSNQRFFQKRWKSLSNRIHQQARQWLHV